MIYILSALFGGFLQRWHGGGFFAAPRWIKQVIWALPFSFLGWPHALSYGPSFSASIGGQATGHGNGQSLGRVPHGKPEKVEIVIAPLKPYLSPFWYDFIILALCALLAVSGGILGAMFKENFVGAGTLFLGAIVSPIAYVVGWAIYPHEVGKGLPFMNKATEIGEFGTGLICFTALAFAYMHG